jgi:hypothetical protein
MRRLPVISLDPMKFVKAFAAGLRAEFADAARAPLPEYLSALTRELEDGDQTQPVSITCDALLPPGNSKSAPKVHSSAPT